MRAINEDDVKRLIRAEKRNWTLTQFPGVTEALNHVEGGLVGIRTVESQIPRWISVEERLPEKGVFVVVYYGNFIGNLMDVYMWDGECWRSSTGYLEDAENITHWMPLPSTEGIK